MLTLVFLLINAQVNFEQKAPIRLNAQSFDFEKITVTDRHILVGNETDQVVYIFDLAGVQVGSLGADDTVQLPSQVSWIKDKNQFYVYDASKREFTIWDATSFEYAGKISTDFDLFFEVGQLQPVQGGFVAPVSLVDKQYLIARYDENFNQGKFKFELHNPELATMSPVLRKTFLARLELNSGIRLVAAQALSTKMKIYDENLGVTDIIHIKIPNWEEPNYKKLEKVSKNPRELEKLKKKFSEIIEIEPISGSLFLVGFRNVFDGMGFYYQIYDATTAQPSGMPLNSLYPSVGSGNKILYLRNPNDGMSLIPVSF